MDHDSFPAGLHVPAIASLAVAATCAIVVALDGLRRPRAMGVMNLVWPVTALFGSALWLAVYYQRGRSSGHHERDARTLPPRPVAVLKGASHCAAGCTPGDLVAERLSAAVPGTAVWFGSRSLFGERMFAIRIPNFLLASLLGIAFRYFAVEPMRDLSVGQDIVRALKADIASIAAWQVAMYGMMALIQFGGFRPDFDGLAPVASPGFRWAMQIAMLAGFVASYPVNWWLIAAGVKEAM